MTRNLFIAAALVGIALVGLFAAGLTTATPGLMIAAVLCAWPMLLGVLGAAIGRASNEFAITRKEPQQVIRSATHRMGSSAPAGKVPMG